MPQAAYNVVTLTSGAVIERAIAEGEQHEFQVSVAQGETLRIAADQQGADVTIALQFADAEPLTTDDPSKRRFGRELAAWLAPGSGQVRVAVRGKSVVIVPGASAPSSRAAPGQPGASTAPRVASIPSAGSVSPGLPAPPTGRYRLTLAVLLPSELLTRAVSAGADGLRLSSGPQGKSAEAAAQRLQEAVEAWRALGDRELLAQSLFRLGRLQTRELRRPIDGLATMTDALAIYEEQQAPNEIVGALLQIGFAQLLLGRWEEARAVYERAYTYGAAVDPLNRAVIEDDIARANYEGGGDYDRALSYSQRAAATFRAEGAYRDEAVALQRLANTYARMRRFDDALRTAADVVALMRKHGTDSDAALLMLTLGSIQLAAGDDVSALATFQRAWEQLDAQSGDRVTAMVNIGRIYNRRGETREARAVLEKALAAVPPQLRNHWAAAATELGYSLTAEGEPARALELQRKALEIVQPTRSAIAELTVLRDLAATYRALGDLDGARKTIARAIELAQTPAGRPYEASMLLQQSRNERQAGNLAGARQILDRALDLTDSARGRLHTRLLRSSFGAVSGAFYDEAIDVAMQMHAEAPQAGHDARAFDLFERSRARSLTDLLSESRTDIRADVDPALLEEERALQTQLGRKDTALRELAGKPDAKERAPILEREIDDVTRRIEVLDARIRTASPRYAALQHPVPLSTAETQRLLDDETVLLAFALGSPRPGTGSGTGPGTGTGARVETTSPTGGAVGSATGGATGVAGGVAPGGWGWAITRGALHGFPLPPTARVEEAARKVYAGLAARQSHAAPEGAARLAQIDRDLAVDAAALSDLVLGPIADRLRGEWRHSRLAIVATGPLEYIPFAALPVPTATGPTATGPTATGPSSVRSWLVETHELVQLPSASVLAWLRSDEGDRSRASRGIAVMADAVYTADDPRVHARTAGAIGGGARARPGAAAGPSTRAAVATDPVTASATVPAIDSATAPATDPTTGPTIEPTPRPTNGDAVFQGLERDTVRSGFRRLAFSREEATVISKLAAGSRVLEALDFKASLATIASPAIADARIVHIASHGILNSARPELSGLVLSLVDEAGQPQEGVLRLYDIFNLKLSADLVVLSGCQTGLGRQMKGEGLVGLTRAFMYAGAPRVVASLWQVDDLATSELMRRFYHGMLVRKLSAAAALRGAQQEMRTSSRWQSPYYWAAFALVGDWRETTRQTR